MILFGMERFLNTALESLHPLLNALGLGAFGQVNLAMAAYVLPGPSPKPGTFLVPTDVALPACGLSGDQAQGQFARLAEGERKGNGRDSKMSR